MLRLCPVEFPDGSDHLPSNAAGRAWLFSHQKTCKECVGGVFIRECKFKSNSDLPLTLNAMDVAEALGISRAAAYTLVQSESFPHMRIGKRILVPKEAFLRWIAEQTENADSRL